MGTACDQGAVLSKLRASEDSDGKDPIIPRTKSQFQLRYLPTVKQLCIAGGFFIAFQLLGEGVYPAILKKSPEFNALSAVRQR